MRGKDETRSYGFLNKEELGFDSVSNWEPLGSYMHPIRYAFCLYV